ncbi:MAG TPA: hypothetical protein PKO06_17765, partial [Candidatus Ozemobacteraceae bacterium]|nr:hypothetical protein [Candidatus Ozemobacteraceae bacterium]
MNTRTNATWNVLGLFLGIAVTVSLILGCGGGGGGGGNPVAPANQQLADLRGTVTFNGAPVADAAVYLVKPENALNAGMNNAGATGNIIASPTVSPLIRANTAFGDYDTTTNQNGEYTFSQVPV